jgi:hypothetical protein
LGQINGWDHRTLSLITLRSAGIGIGKNGA